MALPGLPDHPALRPRSPILAAAREVLYGPQTSFLLLAPTEPGGYLRVTALGMPQDAAHHLSLVVVLSPWEDLHGLGACGSGALRGGTLGGFLVRFYLCVGQGVRPAGFLRLGPAVVA